MLKKCVLLQYNYLLIKTKKMKNTELNQALRHIYKKYNNTDLSNEVLDNFNNTQIKEEPKGRGGG